jgi:undecaprenyl-diphosphatase
MTASSDSKFPGRFDRGITPSRRRSPRVLITGLVTGALAVGFTLWVKQDPVDVPWKSVDTGWNDFLSHAHDVGFLSGLAKFVNWFGAPPGVLVTMFLPMIVLLVLRRWWGALFFFATGLLSSVVSQGFKQLVDRPRPTNPMVEVDHGSFPSGHVITTVCTVFALVVVIQMLSRSKRKGYWWVAGFTALMVVDRTYLSAHWLSDTAASVLIGISVTSLIWWAMHPLLVREAARKASFQVPAELAA